MVRIVRRYQQMNVNPSAFHSADSKSQLNVWKDESDVWQTPILLFRGETFIYRQAAVIRRADRLNHRRGVLQLLQVLDPRVASLELIVHQRPGPMEMWVPAVPM